jgi:hypothetical protein
MENRRRGSTEEKLPMIQRRLRVAKWLSTTPALGVCTLSSREFKVPMSALRRTTDAQASLQEQFDRHKCDPKIRAKPMRGFVSMSSFGKGPTKRRRKKKRTKGKTTATKMTMTKATGTRSECAPIYFSG